MNVATDRVALKSKTKITNFNKCLKYFCGVIYQCIDNSGVLNTDHLNNELFEVPISNVQSMSYVVKNVWYLNGLLSHMTTI